MTVTGGQDRMQRTGAYGICVRDGRILLSRYLSGRWSLPGGGVDFGEHPEASVVREVAEETGYACEVTELIGIESGGWTTRDQVPVHSISILYGIEVTGGELTHEVDGTSDMAAWIALDEIATRPHTKTLDAVLARLDVVGTRPSR